MRRERARAYTRVMRSSARCSNALDTLLAALQAGVCDQAAARQLYMLGPHAVTLALLAAARRIAEQDTRLALLEARDNTSGGVSPATPSGMIPVYGKANVAAGQTARGRRRQRPGARDGHPGYRRPGPARIDRRQTHRLKCCPHCRGQLQRCRRTRRRIIVDLFVLDRQYCLVHLLRELEKVDQHNTTLAWQAFAKVLRRLIRDGIRLRKRSDFTPQKYRSRILRLGRRLDALTATESTDTDVRRLLKRLRRTGDHIFTFLDYPQIPFENNFAERQIRPAVILRKHSQSNRSDRGAITQAVLMSVYRTLRLPGHDPLQTIADALRTYLQAGQLPSLPPGIIADG